MTELVLVPGLLCTSLLWEHQILHLRDLANVTVADVTGVDSIEAMADAVLATSPPKFALCGLSMGGIVAHEIMRQAPQRVEKLALLDTNARADTPEQTERRHGLLAMADRGEFAGVTMALISALVHPSRVKDASLIMPTCAMAAAVGAEAFHRQVTAIINRQESLSILSSYACPTLILCGHEDAITPLEMHEEMADGIKNSELAIIEECGHLATMERPQAVTALLRQWLLYS
ncbi:MAG: alpha/beta fold hydrolase [Gammaproteobacteria bacterium]